MNDLDHPLDTEKYQSSGFSLELIIEAYFKNHTCLDGGMAFPSALVLIIILAFLIDLILPKQCIKVVLNLMFEL